MELAILRIVREFVKPRIELAIGIIAPVPKCGNATQVSGQSYGVAVAQREKLPAGISRSGAGTIVHDITVTAGLVAVPIRT